MRRAAFTVLAIAVGCVLGFFIASRTLSVRGAAKPGMGAVAIPGQVGGQDIFGAYEVVPGWPKDISTLPGNEKWTYGAGQSVYAESPNRVFMLYRGELPNIKRPPTKLLSEFGPSIQFPIGRLPFRDATVASLPGAGGTGQNPGAPTDGWNGKQGLEAKREYCIAVADAYGNHCELWTVIL